VPDSASPSATDRPPLPGTELPGTELPATELAELSATERTRHRRLREQGRADRADLHAVLAAGLVAHLGLPAAGGVMVIPTVYGTDGTRLYLHGSVASQSLAADAPVCVTITLVDGLVLARSLFEHAVNYRSAMIYGVPRAVTDPGEILAGLRCLSEHAAPGQWDYARQPSRKELAATRLLALDLTEASVKIRTGPPEDAGSPDAALGLWAGEVPLEARWQQPVPDPALPPGQPVPAHIQALAGTLADRPRPAPADRQRPAPASDEP
jgi:nitroimidazol reductase NimA-like FMN-containing flavoprotein (pyridoxamine 5'-phosphate oxidase superfamily)